MTIVAGEDAMETAGRLCLWSQTEDTRDPDKYDNFTSYRQTLKLKCGDSPKTASFIFTPDSGTPDTLYYQVFCFSAVYFTLSLIYQTTDPLTDTEIYTFTYNFTLCTSLRDTVGGIQDSIMHCLPVFV